MGSRHSVKVIAVTGGKGGVGKTNVSINLSVALANLGRRVMLLDADLGLANIDVLLGLKPKRNLADVFDYQCELKDVVIDGPSGIKVIPASSGTQSMVNLGKAEHAGLISAFSAFGNEVDYLVIDTAAGLSDTVTSFVSAAQEVVLVVCNEPSSITDAYAQLKLLNKEFNVQRFRMISNDVRSLQEGRHLYTKLVNVCDRFLDVSISYEGSIPHDEHLREAVQKQEAVMSLYPSCKASKSFVKLAERAEDWPVLDDSNGHLEFFVDQLVQNSQKLPQGMVLQ